MTTTKISRFFQTKVCIKFEAAPKWFLSEGTNGYCGVNECCEWYPKETEKVVFCSPKRPLLNWFPLPAGGKCDDVADKESTSKVGVEITKGSVSRELAALKLACFDQEN